MKGVEVTGHNAGSDVIGNALVAQHISTGYGPAQALWDVDVTVAHGEAVALIGANGAGKTTLLRAIAGQLPLWNGQVTFKGNDLAGSAAYQRVEAGVVMVPEGRRLFSGLSVRENLLMGAYSRSNDVEIQEDLQWVYSLFPQLHERRKQLGGHLSGGEQQMCAIGRALMARPRLLMIDELSLGLAPVIVDRLTKVLGEIHDEGITLLIVEQDVATALDMSQRGYLIENGRITLEGSKDDLLNDPRVQASFLGI